MITTDANKNSVKERREQERKEKEAEVKQKCEALAIERLGGVQELLKLSNANKGLWFLPVMNEDGEIDKMAMMKPIDRHILSYASTKLTDGGLYEFLEVAMRECFIQGDREILDDDDYFLPASTAFNKIIDGKKAHLLKR